MLEDPKGLGIIGHLLLSFFAGIGGTLGYLVRSIQQGKKLSWLGGLLAGMASAYIGFLVCLIGEAMEFDWRWVGAMAGVLGWIGAEASISILSRVVRNKLGIKDND